MFPLPRECSGPAAGLGWSTLSLCRAGRFLSVFGDCVLLGSSYHAEPSSWLPRRSNFLTFPTKMPDDGARPWPFQPQSDLTTAPGRPQAARSVHRLGRSHEWLLWVLTPEFWSGLLATGNSKRTVSFTSSPGN